MGRLRHGKKKKHMLKRGGLWSKAEALSSALGVPLNWEDASSVLGFKKKAEEIERLAGMEKKKGHE